jgi:diaminohydroxyphosphoribosylaminopyrimidine deaminase/5-amino-6-(5-phosphoribosylamino)uracil reductase
MRHPSDDIRYMHRALTLAVRGRGRTSPNPVVGAVVVKDGRVVGEGWHRALGEAHAEVVALAAAGAKARGATMYVTLEPCAHTGRTPPCVDALLAAGIRRCVVAVRDPHRIVDGRGLRRLRAAGVHVEVGLCADQARESLGGYWLVHTRGLPRVTLKLAASLDGRVAPAAGFAARGPGRWLTGAPARRTVHQMRAHADAVVIGGGTARADDPRLTSRGVGAARQPLRVVCDTRLALPPDLRLFRAPLARGTVVACGPRAPRAAEARLVARGVTVWRLPAPGGAVSPVALLRRLARDGRYEVLLEGGATLAASWLAAGVVDRLGVFTAPAVLGDAALAWAPALRVPRRGTLIEHRMVGDDLWTLVRLGA